MLPLLAFAATSLIGDVLFHMLPFAVKQIGNTHLVFLLVAFGLVVFLILEQFMHWYHFHRATVEHKEPALLRMLF